MLDHHFPVEPENTPARLLSSPVQRWKAARPARYRESRMATAIEAGQRTTTPGAEERTLLMWPSNDMSFQVWQASRHPVEVHVGLWRDTAAILGNAAVGNLLAC